MESAAIRGIHEAEVMWERCDMSSMEGFFYLESTFRDSLIEFDYNFVIIKYGRLKRVVEFLMDCGVNFTYVNGVVKFHESELRMVDGAGFVPQFVG